MLVHYEGVDQHGRKNDQHYESDGGILKYFSVEEVAISTLERVFRIGGAKEACCKTRTI